MRVPLASQMADTRRHFGRPAHINVTPHRLRVCLVSPLPPPYGGIGHWTLMMLRHARARSDVSIDVIDISPRWRDFHDLGTWKRVLGGGVQLCRDLARLTATLVTRRPDVAHITTPGRLAPVRDVAMIALAKAFRSRAVYHLRFGRVPEIADRGTREWQLIRTAIAMADVVVPIDVATERALRAHVPSAQVVRVPNFLDPAEMPASGPVPAAEDRFVMFLGWLQPSKGLDELLAAWNLVNPTGWRLVVAGPGQESYRRELLERHRPANVEFVGELSHEEAMRTLAAASAFIFPSRTEGFPNVVLEAMVLGKPIVASDVGAIPEMLADGCGLVVPARDVDQLAGALRRVLDDEHLRTEMGIRARRRALTEYSIAAVFEQYLTIWRGRPDGPRAQPDDGLRRSAGAL
jgi:glycosyltransferase involved in cell wall biosynthesis